MPTFNNGESAASVRTKINDAIDKVDGASPITSVNIDSGTIDDTTIGGATAAAGTFTNLTANTDLTINGTTTVTAILDEDNMASDSATALATQQSIKAYVDSQVTAQDLDFTGDSGTGAIDLDSQTFTVAGTANQITTAASGQTVTISLPATIATTTADLTNLEVTNIKAKDGTASATIANSTGVMTIASSVLTTTDINGGTIDGTTIGGASAGAGTFTTLTATGNVTLGDAATDTVTITADVASNIIPSADDTYDLGASGSEWKDLYIDGTANIDSLVADTADINGGTIDGVTIATSDITVGAGKTLNVSAGTLTLANDQISGDSVEGGTINAITINTLGATTVNATTVDSTDVEVTNIKAKDGTASATIADSTGVMTIASSVLTTTDINGGTIDGTTIGGSTPAAISGTTGTFSGNLTVDTDTLFVDAANNEVGIGTTTPRGILDINASDPQTVYIADATDGITLGHSGSDSFITLGSVSTGAVGVFNYARGTGALTYSEGTVGSEVEYLRIDTGGRMLQGTDSAIIGAGSLVAINQVAGISALASRSAFVYSATNTAASVYEMGKSADGTVGNHALVDNGEVLGVIRWSGSDGTNFIRAAEIGAIVNGTPGTSDMPGALTFSTTADAASSPTERMRITSAGFVGIGTNSPATALDVDGTITSDGLTVDGTSSLNGDITMNTGTPQLKMYSPSSVNGYDFTANVSDTVDGGLNIRDIAGKQLVQIKSNNDISFYEDTGTTPKFFWDASTERLGLGTNSPGFPLDVQVDGGGATITSRILNTGTDAADDAALRIGTSGTAGETSVFFGDGGSATVGRVTYDHNNERMEFWTNSTQQVTIDSSGNVGIGETNPSQALDVVGSIEVSGGIYLGGTTSVNLLDDYEEGTWTAQIYDASTGGNVSATTVTGYYTKVGRMVTASASFLNIDTTGMTAGSAIYLTLPFTNAIPTAGSVRLYANVEDTTVSLGVFASSSATRVTVQESRDNAALANVTVGDLIDDASDLAFTITYQV